MYSSSPGRRQEPGTFTQADDTMEKSLLREDEQPHDPLMFIRHTLRSLQIPSISSPASIRRIIGVLVPSFLQRTDRPQKLYPTAYLDGLRGAAAFAVFLHHWSEGFFPVKLGYHSSPQARSLLLLPILQLIHGGPAMVSVFFVISGYALSCKPLKQMRSRSYDSLLQTLSSSVFRRGFRLFLPCFISTFIILVLVRIRVYEITRPFSQDPAFVRYPVGEHKDRFEHLSDQLKDWTGKIFDFVHVFNWMIFSGSIDYDRYLWTIPVEFRASLLLFISLFATARLKPTLRICAFAGMSYWAYLWVRWELPLFWFGAILAELDLIKTSKNINISLNPGQHADRSSRRRIWKAFRVMFLLLSLYLLSYPDIDGHLTPGYRLLSSFIPYWYPDKNRFWESIGAIMTVWCINNDDRLQTFFNSAPMQYLGRISYALYLVHSMVIHTVGYLLLDTAWFYLDWELQSQFVLGFSLATLVMVPVSIWVADVFYRVVDAPCVKFAKWLEEICIVS